MHVSHRRKLPAHARKAQQLIVDPLVPRIGESDRSIDQVAQVELHIPSVNDQVARGITEGRMETDNGQVSASELLIALEIPAQIFGVLVPALEVASLKWNPERLPAAQP